MRRSKLAEARSAFETERLRHAEQDAVEKSNQLASRNKEISELNNRNKELRSKEMKNNKELADLRTRLEETTAATPTGPAEPSGLVERLQAELAAAEA